MESFVTALTVFTQRPSNEMNRTNFTLLLGVYILNMFSYYVSHLIVKPSNIKRFFLRLSFESVKKEVFNKPDTGSAVLGDHRTALDLNFTHSVLLETQQSQSLSGENHASVLRPASSD